MCSWTGYAETSLFPPHADDDGAVCVMSTRPIPEREDDGPVTDGAGAASVDGAAGGPATMTP